MEKRCNFEGGKCDIECSKYSMCAFMSIQKQLSSLQEQLNFLFSALGSVVENNNSVTNNLADLDNKLNIFTQDMLDLFNTRSESEAKKESLDNEETYKSLH